MMRAPKIASLLLLCGLLLPLTATADKYGIDEVSGATGSGWWGLLFYPGIIVAMYLIITGQDHWARAGVGKKLFILFVGAVLVGALLDSCSHT